MTNKSLLVVVSMKNFLCEITAFKIDSVRFSGREAMYVQHHQRSCPQKISCSPGEEHNTSNCLIEDLVKTIRFLPAGYQLI